MVSIMFARVLKRAHRVEKHWFSKRKKGVHKLKIEFRVLSTHVVKICHQLIKLQNYIHFSETSGKC